MSKAFITGKIAIESMRDNGYKNTAYALAELIDNSLQAKARRVDVICLEKMKKKGDRNLNTVDEILILDNGEGMSPETLYLALEFGASENRNDKNGMGKFGMGLPNSSISQCRRVDVWSWQKPGEYHYTYLDVAKMKAGELEQIPGIIRKDLPSEIIKCLPNELPPSGTLILWSDLDRLLWKTSKSIKRHSEKLVGRMYRKFISSKQSSIWFSTASRARGYNTDATEFRANDPLYLTKNSTLPGLPDQFLNEEFFEEVDNVKVDIEYDNEVHQVLIRASAPKKPILDHIREVSQNVRAGATKWGKDCNENLGVSIIRAGRELDLQKFGFFSYSLMNSGLGRWIGIEVEFPPALDVVFGVTNNKQQARNFYNLKIDEDAAREAYGNDEETDLKAYERELEENNDPKLHMYKISTHVRNCILVIQKDYLSNINFGDKKGQSDGSNKFKNAAKAATRQDEIRQVKGHGVKADDETHDKPELTDGFKTVGFSEKEALERAEEILKDKLKYWFEETTGIQNNSFFDVSRKRGCDLVFINQNHNFYDSVFDKLDHEQKHDFCLALGAWARMENEASDRNKELCKNFRQRWGEVMENFLLNDIDGD